MGSEPEGRKATFGRYELLEEVGRGGMGVVWKAYDPELKRVVALKQILLGPRTTPEDVERFLREARLTARLRHPNIVSIYDAGQVHGQSYYTSDFIEGRSLADLAARPLVPHEVAAWIRTIALALDHAHSQGVLHRDVKPGNILIGRDGQPYLTDFGLAKQLRTEEETQVQASLTVSGTVLGTPNYMSPEQASAEGEIGPASDQFSLGVVLYEVLTGRRPFEGKTAFEVTYAILRDEPPPPRSIRPQVHPDLETICLRCLEKPPARRYPSLSDMAADLDRYLRGEAIHARPVSAATKLARRIREHRTLLLAGVTLLLLLGIGLSYFLSRSQRSRALAQALSEARAAKENGKVREAHDAFSLARELEANSAEAREGLAWADAEQRRLDAEAHRQEEGLKKSGPVTTVVTRWVYLSPTILRLQQVSLDPTLDDATRRAQSESLWADVEKFRRETPSDPSSQATMLAFSGWAKLLAGDREGAIAWMDEARRADPDVPYGAMMRAIACLLDFMQVDLPRVQATGGDIASAGVFAQSRARLHAEVDPLLEEVHRASVWGGDLARQVDTMLRIVDAMSTGRLAEADGMIAEVQVIPGMQPMEGYMVRLRADLHVQMKDIRGALPLFDEAIHANPYIPGIYSDRAWAKEANADRRGAIEDFTEQIRLAPSDVGARLDRARMRGETGDAKGEREDLDAAIAIAPESGDARLRRGATRLSQGDAKGAVADLEVATRVEPRNSDALLQLASAEIDVGDADGAVRTCDRILAFEPKNANAYAKRGYAKKLKGELDEAIADFDRAIQIGPANPEAFNNRGRAKYAKGDCEGAIADYSSAIALRPSYPEAIGNRARAKEKKGDLAGAIEDYDLALRVAPPDWPHRAEIEGWRKSAAERTGH